MPKQVFAESVVTYIDLPNGYSDTIAVNPETNTIYADSGNSIVAIDGSTNEVTATIPLEDDVFDIEVNPDTNKVYATLSNSDTVIVIDGSSNDIMATIHPYPLHQAMTRALAINPSTNKIYVNNFNWSNGFNIISEIDGSTDTTEGSIEYDPSCGFAGMDINPVSNILYATGCIDVLVIDLGSESVITDIRVDSSGVWGIDTNPNTNMVYAGVRGWDKGGVYAIDGSTNTQVARPFTGADTAEVAVNPNTNTIYNANADTLFAIDGSTNMVKSQTPIDLWTNTYVALAVNPSTNMVYVSGVSQDNTNNGKIAVIDADGDTSTASTSSHLTVNSKDTAANPIYGYYTILSQNGAVQDTGFTPATFTLNSDEQYTVEVQDYGQYTFDHWADTASTDRDRSISISSDTAITAIYRNVNEPASGDGGSQDDGSGEQDGGSTGTSGTSSITVNTKDDSGNTISGYYTTLSQNGAVVGSGFSPATFTVDNCDHETDPQSFKVSDSCSYFVTVYDYGQYVFDHWQLADGSTSYGSRSTGVIEGTTSNDAVLTAVYRNANSPPDEQTPEDNDADIMVKSVDSHNNSIDGYYTTLSEDGQVVDSGFTPETFSLVIKDMYTISVADYGDYVFDHWAEDGSTDRDKLVSIACCAGDGGSLMFTAVYRNINERATESPEQPPEQTTDTISVTTIDSSGNQIYGYYTTLSENGNVVQSAFSPAEFTADSGQTYQVATADYGQYTFDHWSDGSTERFHDAVAGDSLAAVYRS